MSIKFSFTIADPADANRLERNLRRQARIFTRQGGNVKDGRYDIADVTVTRAIEVSPEASEAPGS
jgi:hypothetical protein